MFANYQKLLSSSQRTSAKIVSLQVIYKLSFDLGIVRYWPSIAHEGSSQETSADLQGQECCLLTDVQPVGSVLATTTSTVVLVQRPESSAAMPGGQHALTCR